MRCVISTGWFEDTEAKTTRMCYLSQIIIVPSGNIIDEIQGVSGRYRVDFQYTGLNVKIKKIQLGSWSL